MRQQFRLRARRFCQPLAQHRTVRRQPRRRSLRPLRLRSRSRNSNAFAKTNQQTAEIGIAESGLVGQHRVMGFKTVTLIVAGIFALGTLSVRAQDAGALLDLLVRKKLITDQEAEEVRAELTKESATTSAGKWKLSTPITEIELYGDARLRYEIRSGETDSQDTQQRNLPRYRLRLGLRGILADDWFFGVRLETGTNPRSSNVTFGDDSGGGNGPFAKNSDGIFVGQAYLGYKGFHDIILTAGKMPNPLVTTLMVWDADINPEGLAEQWKHTFNISLGEGNVSGTATVDSKDGKAVAPPAAAKLKIDLFANFAQFVYDDSNPENPLGP